MKTMNDPVKTVAEAHTNLNVWGVIVSILEGGNLYGGRGQDTACQIIRLCHMEQQKELRLHDQAAAKLRGKR